MPESSIPSPVSSPPAEVTSAINALQTACSDWKAKDLHPATHTSNEEAAVTVCAFAMRPQNDVNVVEFGMLFALVGLYASIHVSVRGMLMLVSFSHGAGRFMWREIMVHKFRGTKLPPH